LLHHRWKGCKACRRHEAMIANHKLLGASLMPEYFGAMREEAASKQSMLLHVPAESCSIQCLKTTLSSATTQVQHVESERTQYRDKDPCDKMPVALPPREDKKTWATLCAKAM